MNKTTICTLVWLRLQEHQPGLIPLTCPNCRFERKKQTKTGKLFLSNSVQITKDAEMIKTTKLTKSKCLSSLAVLT